MTAQQMERIARRLAGTLAAAGVGLGLTGSAQAQDKVGTSAMAFSRIGIGARAVGMGGGQLAVANDLTTLFWNPAGLTRLSGTRVQVDHANWFVDSKLDWVGGSVNLGNAGAVGVSVTSVRYGNIEYTSDATPDGEFGSGRTFSPNDVSIQLSYAKSLTDAFSLGGSGKYLRESISQSSASAYAFELGMLFKTPFRGVTLAASMTNFGSKTHVTGNDLLQPVTTENPARDDDGSTMLNTQRWNMPLAFNIGVSYLPVSSEQNELLLAVDASHPTDQAESLNLGAQYGWNKILFLRAGYKNLFLPESDEGLTLGAGVQQKLYDVTFTFDYAYQTFRNLNAPQWLSVGVQF